MTHVRRCFETEDIYTDDTQLDKYLGLSKYFPNDKLFEWEVFVLALHCCTYRKVDGMPRWPALFCLSVEGRTNSPKGKDGLCSSAVIFNEIHQYPDYANINVFNTRLGKKKPTTHVRHHQR